MTAGRPKRPSVFYTVYDNRTDFPVIVSGDARSSADAMGVKFSSFYSLVHRCRHLQDRRWTILRTCIDRSGAEHEVPELLNADGAAVSTIRLYDIYDRRRKLWIAKNVPAPDAAKAMGVKSVHNVLGDIKTRGETRWHIVSRLAAKRKESAKSAETQL